MTNLQPEIESLSVRAKEYYKEVEQKILAYRKDKEQIVGLDPKAKRFWVGETESGILEQKHKEGNQNLVYFIKLSANVPPEKLIAIAS
jgi:23S rRNA pseudoU1915 N3-methylase RlmH